MWKLPDKGDWIFFKYNITMKSYDFIKNYRINVALSLFYDIEKKEME